MKGFIAQLAEDLYTRHRDDISSLCLIVPSRRARLFFNEALSEVCTAPLWQPSFGSIDEIMSEISGQRIADPVRLSTELYKVWSRYHQESYDDFYFWGEMLLSDFDAVDKYLIDPRMIFSNLSEIKEIETDHSYLTDDQREIIQRFWASFGLREGFSPEQETFVNIWNSLAAIYRDFKKVLQAEGLAYTGMMHRTAAEKLHDGKITPEVASRRYVVAGFNALTECEKKLFDALHKLGNTEFHWDYDHYYLDKRNHEAGFFMRGNLQRYPQTHPIPQSREAFAEKKEIVVVSAPSDTLQCKYVSRFLESIDRPGRETAVVLSDETLLEPMLWSIPESVENLNVTMGYPLRQSLVYSFAERLLELQKHKKTDAVGVHFYHSDVIGLLQHPFMQEHEDTTALVGAIRQGRMIYPSAAMFTGESMRDKIFRACTGWRELGEYMIAVLSEVGRSLSSKDDALQVELLTVTLDAVRKLCNTLYECAIDPTERVFASLLRKRLQALRIPFEGEPLLGVQIMGFLETRALDFENVVILSVNDDILPGNISASSSFIPYNLRAAYGLPTPSHHEAMYAYYFYRLLQRARRIHLVYCSRNDEKRKGEHSRYIYQLDYESAHTITKYSIDLDANMPHIQPVSIAKQGEIRQQLSAFLAGKRRLSPTAFFNYVVCPMKFYYRTIAGIEIPEELTEGIDARLFGNILHRSMQQIYSPFVGMADAGGRITALAGSPTVEQAVRDAIREANLHSGVDEAEYGGGLKLVHDVVCRYIYRHILPYDASQRNICFEALEEPLKCDFDFGKERVCFYGLADRIDRLEGGLRRVVDYKTGRKGPGGSLEFEFNGVESLFGGDARASSAAAVQTLLYCMMIAREKQVDVQPSIYAVRHLGEPSYSHLLTDKATGEQLLRYSDYAPRFEQGLAEVLAELFNLDIPFTQCADDKQCQYCDYKQICRRGE